LIGVDTPAIRKAFDASVRTGAEQMRAAAIAAVPTGWTGQPHASTMDFGPNVAAKAIAAIYALSPAPAADMMAPICYDCRRPYSDPGFPDLAIPHVDWRKISPDGEGNGLLCPSCICARLEKSGIRTVDAFTSGPLCDEESTLLVMRLALDRAEAARVPEIAALIAICREWMEKPGLCQSGNGLCGCEECKTAVEVYSALRAIAGGDA